MRMWWNWQTRKIQVLMPQKRTGSNPAIRTTKTPLSKRVAEFLHERQMSRI